MKQPIQMTTINVIVTCMCSKLLVVFVLHILYVCIYIAYVMCLSFALMLHIKLVVYMSLSLITFGKLCTPSQKVYFQVK